MLLVVEVLQDNGVLPSSANEAVPAINMIGALASSYADNIGLSNPKGVQTIALKVFSYGSWLPISVVVDYGNGTNIQKSIAKAVAGAMTAEMIALAATAIGATASAPFAFAIGVVAVGYFAGGFVANQIGTSYDRWIGPEVDGIKQDNGSYIVTTNYTVKETLLLEEYHQNLRPYENSNYTLKSDNDGVTLTYNTTENSYALNLSKSAAESNDYIESLVLYRPFSDFILKTTTSTNDITNLLKKTQSQISSLAKSDEAVMYALANLKSYAISGDSANSVDFTDAYIDDRATMLYWHNVGKTHINGVHAVNVELNARSEYYLDIETGVEYGSGKKHIFGTNGSNRINGNDDTNRLYGMGGNDTLLGGGASDTLYGGSGNDILLGGNSFANNKDGASDTLIGGEGFDTYYAEHTDTIKDSDGKGKILFGGISLSGEKTSVGTSGNTYEDDHYTYSLANPNGVGTLTILKGTQLTGFTGEHVFVQDFKSGDLGITLEN